jgi:hypothetical protein
LENDSTSDSPHATLYVRVMVVLILLFVLLLVLLMILAMMVINSEMAYKKLLVEKIVVSQTLGYKEYLVFGLLVIDFLAYYGTKFWMVGQMYEGEDYVCSGVTYKLQFHNTAASFGQISVDVIVSTTIFGPKIWQLFQQARNYYNDVSVQPFIVDAQSRGLLAFLEECVVFDKAVVDAEVLRLFGRCKQLEMASLAWDDNSRRRIAAALLAQELILKDEEKKLLNPAYCRVGKEALAGLVDPLRIIISEFQKSFAQ